MPIGYDSLETYGATLSVTASEELAGQRSSRRAEISIDFVHERLGTIVSPQAR
jgi:hypothetical protein